MECIAVLFGGARSLPAGKGKLNYRQIRWPLILAIRFTAMRSTPPTGQRIAAQAGNATVKRANQELCRSCPYHLVG